MQRSQTAQARILKLIVALWSIGLLRATLSPRAYAQATAPEPATLPAAPPVVASPPEAVPATAPPDTPVLVIADNELRLDGTVAAVNVAQNSLTLDVSSFTLPSVRRRPSPRRSPKACS